MRATVQLNAIGDADAYGRPITTAAASTVIGAGVTFRGARVTVTDYAFSNGSVKLTLKKGGAFVKSTHNDASFSSTGSTTIDGSAVLYLGDAAAGIYVDISLHDGRLTVREAGVRNPNGFYSVSGDTVTLSELTNNLRGEAFLYADNAPTLTVYDQAMLPLVLITNSTDYTVVLPNVYLINSGYINPQVTGVKTDLRTVSYDNPTVTVETSGSGGLTVNGFLSNHQGEVAFRWTGETGGALNAVAQVMNLSSGTMVYPIWAHVLEISGAGSIGSAGSTVNAYVFAGSNGLVRVDAQGDIFLNVVPVVLHVVDGSGNALEDHTDPVIIERVVSHEGNVALTLEEGVEATMSPARTPSPSRSRARSATWRTKPSRWGPITRSADGTCWITTAPAMTRPAACTAIGCPTARSSTWTSSATSPASRRAARRQPWASTNSSATAAAR